MKITVDDETPRAGEIIDAALAKNHLLDPSELDRRARIAVYNTLNTAFNDGVAYLYNGEGQHPETLAVTARYCQMLADLGTHIMMNEESEDSSAIIHEIAVDGLPDMTKLVGRVAFLWNGSLVSGWPIDEDFEGFENGVQKWEPSEDRFGGPVTGVTHWVEFPYTFWTMHKKAEKKEE